MDQQDRPGVIAPPPLIFGIGLGVGLAADWLSPSGLDGIMTSATRYGIGAALAAVAIVIAVFAFMQFRKARTHVEPWKPTTAIIADGLYRITRNPLYIASALLYAGIAVAAGSGWALVMLVPVMLVIEFGVVRREEAYLEAKFGDTYRAYKEQVRRWF